MLFEEGAFALGDPIAKFLPEFSHLQFSSEAVEILVENFDDCNLVGNEAVPPPK